MIYILSSFVLCGVATACFEHNRTLAGMILMILSCFMPIIKDFYDQQPSTLPSPASQSER